MPGRDTDPVGNYNFLVEIEGVSAGAFSEVSGLDLTTEVIEYRSGSDTAVRKLPGLHKVNNITLKRGIIKSDALWQWYKTVLDGQARRSAASIVLLDEKREEYARWNLYEAWPCKYAGPHLNASGNEVAIEELVLAAERIEMAD